MLPVGHMKTAGSSQSTDSTGRAGKRVRRPEKTKDDGVPGFIQMQFLMMG